MSEGGYVKGQSVVIEYRWAEGRYDRLPALAADLVGHKVDVIATGSLAGLQAAKSATSTIPVALFGGGDLVALGLVASLARPGCTFCRRVPSGAERGRQRRGAKRSDRIPLGRGPL